MSSYKGVKDSLLYFHDLVFNREFMRAFSLVDVMGSEREVSLPLRFFLAGIFNDVFPESNAHEKLQLGIGRPNQIDFKIGNLALEIATRSEKEPFGKLRKENNVSEIRKLLKHDGKSILALLDFKDYMEDDEKLDKSISSIDEYIRVNPLGKGNHNSTNYKVMYFYRYSGESECKVVDAYR